MERIFFIINHFAVKARVSFRLPILCETCHLCDLVVQNICMNKFEKNIEIRWADLDPNFHVLHSKYYDFGAYCRMAFMVEHGLTPAVFMKHHFGPIIFREECVFKKEITFGDKVTVSFKVDKITTDFGRWTLICEIFKNEETLAATVTVDGAWMDTVARKLTIPPTEWVHLFDKAPKSDTFSLNERIEKK